MQSNEEVDIANYKRYLLGDLPAPEAEAIDREIISDAGSEEKMLWAESELMEDYLDETLSPREVELFRENFLVSAERLAQLEQISAIKNFVRRPMIKGFLAKTPETPPESFYERLRTFFSLDRRAALAAFALLVVGVFAVFFLTANRQTGLEREFAQANRKDLRDLAEFKEYAELNLMSGAFRDAGGVPKLAGDKLTEKVFFRLALPVQSSAPDKYKAELARDGKIVFTQTELPFYTNPYGQEMRLLLPAAVLKKGIYQIRLGRENTPESVFIYNFAVE